MPDAKIAGIKLLCGPTRLKSRIFVRNLPNCTREELAAHCMPFGVILGSLVEGKYGYIQFTKESIAQAAIDGLDNSVFKSRFIKVQNASYRSLEENGFVY
ncbi:uncharacterized protein LOC108091235 [Drosophila ficusphila]|uniref:uncharacterized protein LOC108091235 n=1 Tax=Drosophila ficusphila TaxID=30025 RepID=UPI0007E82D1B|nr:uncharacterized protein LOC108091235 [Drosophila ficusphila]